MADSFDEDDASGQGYVSLSTPSGDMKYIFVLEYNVAMKCALIGSPSELGIQQVDNKVLQPTTIDMRGIVKLSKAKGLVAALKNQTRTKTLSKIENKFTGKSGNSWDKMVIVDFAEMGRSERFDAIEVKIVLQEYLEHNKIKK